MDVMAVVVASFVAAVDFVSEAAAYDVVAGQEAVTEHVPVPLVIVTVAVALVAVPPTGPTEQTPWGVIVGIVLALVVAVTVKVLP